MRYAYPCTLTPDDEDGGFVVTFPDVPEAITGGDDRDEALTMAADALSVALAGYMIEGHRFPVPGPLADGQALVSVEADRVSLSR